MQDDDKHEFCIGVTSAEEKIGWGRGTHWASKILVMFSFLYCVWIYWHLFYYFFIYYTYFTNIILYLIFNKRKKTCLVVALHVPRDVTLPILMCFLKDLYCFLSFHHEWTLLCMDHEGWWTQREADMMWTVKQTQADLGQISIGLFNNNPPGNWLTLSDPSSSSLKWTW